MNTLINDNIICPKCNESLPKEQFIRVIRRRTYDIGCDDDGYTYFGKPTKLCTYCRAKQNRIMNDRNHIIKFNKKNKMN
jgi:hypothetical protein